MLLSAHAENWQKKFASYKQAVTFGEFHYAEYCKQSRKTKLIWLKYDPHVTVVTETWLTNEVDKSEVVLSSHKIFRRDRSARGGSVAMALKSSIDAGLLDQINVFLWERMYVV